MEDRMENTAVKADTTHLPYLDGWRGISLALVLIAHFYGFVYNIGYTGVNFFFVLSGLLMARILFVNKTPLTTFYRNRIARVFPVFYLYLLTIIFFNAHEHLDIHRSDFFYSAIFLRTYFGGSSIWDERILPLCHFWSLNVEEHCYMLLSIVGMLAMTRSEAFARNIVTVAACVCVIFYGVYKIAPPQSASQHFLRSECAGFALLSSSAIFLWLRYFKWNIPWFVPVMAAPAGVLVEAYATRGWALHILSPLLLAIAVNTLQSAPLVAHRVLQWRPLCWLGVCSYSIYIWQQVFFAMVEYHPFYIRCMGLVMGIGIGAVSFYFYEQPTRRWIRSLGSRPCQSRRMERLPGKSDAA